MIKTINTKPNPILYKKARICQPKGNSLLDMVVDNENKFWSDEIVQHIQDLKDTAISVQDKCVGLSSCQIWDDLNTAPLAVFVIKLPKSPEEWIWQEFINPQIKTSGRKIKWKESCMSVPNGVKVKTREENVSIEFQTLINPEVQKNKLYYKIHEFITIVMQHEYDHLQGKLIL